MDGPNLVGANGSPITVHRIDNVVLNIAGIDLPLQIVIANGLTAEAILGLDFMEAQESTIDTGKKLFTLTRHGVSLPLSRHGAEVQSYPCMSVRLQETRCIPRQSEIEVVAQVDHLITGGNWIVEQDPKRSLPVMVARAVVSPNRGEIPIRVMNVGNDAITMYRGTILAVAEELDGNHNVAIETVQHEKEVTKSMDPDTNSLLGTLPPACVV